MTPFDRLKGLADKQQMSINDVENKVGLGKNTLYSWKKKIPGGQNLEKVADYFHVSTDYLLGRTDEPHQVRAKDTLPDVADEDIILSFEGKQIPPEDLETIRRFLRGGKDEHKR